MPDHRTLPRLLPPLFLALALLSLYLYTMAPGLTWANSGSDGGGLITAAYMGGVAHPTGYPLYLILARAFQLVPIGTLAYRTNLMSAIAMAVTAVIIYRLVTQSLKDQGLDHAWLAGLTAGFAFGLAPLVWSQAVITEVYALQSVLTASILYLFTFQFENLQSRMLDCLRGLSLGLAMGNHVTTALLIPLILISGRRNVSDAGSRSSNLRPAASSLIRQLVWLAIGLLPYLTLPLRALTDPPINWGNPITFKRFWWLVSGELYRSYYLQFNLVEIWERLQAWASLLVQQFGWLGLAMGILGLVLFYAPSRLYLCTIWLGISYSLFAITYTSDDSFVYLIPVYISFAVWIGLGVGNVLGKFPLSSRVVVWGMGVLIAGYFAFRVPGCIGQVDASTDLRAESFGRQVMAEVPNDALVFVKGDRAIFGLWYFHFALNQRPDLVVIAEELLHFDWYQETLQDAYPGLIVPGPFPWSQNVADANPARPVCYVQYEEQTEIDCNRMGSNNLP